jgi:uncharacterized membrane-anchored protein YhcB (DUF1043 family)
MDGLEASPALRRRLGEDGVSELIELGQAWGDRTLAAASDRFERRIVEETANLRVEMNAGFAKLREEMATGSAKLREEMATSSAKLREEMVNNSAKLREEMANSSAKLREEMATGFAKVREEMAQVESSLRVDIANTRSELLKWAFLFWVGQAATVAGLMALMFRTMGR